MAAQELTNKLFKIYPWLVIGLIIAFIISHLIYNTFVPTYLSGKVVKIPKGMSVAEVAKVLENEGIIRSRFYFLIWQKLILSEETIKSAVYTFEGFYNLLDVVKVLKKGIGIKVVIPEGKTAKEIEDILANSTGIRIDFSKYRLNDFPELPLANYFGDVPLEGFLAPDTYYIYPNEEERALILKILKNFEQRYLIEILRGPLEPYQNLILASIIEKEAKLKEDFPLIADILLRRFNKKMSLDVDAPIVYRLCGGVFCDKKFVSSSLPKDDPFQTYSKIGLIPQPISNPGLEAIKAVIKPQTNDFWYYLNEPKTGKAIFAKSLKEHQQNILKYLKNNNQR